MIRDKLKAVDWGLVIFIIFAVALSLFLWETTGQVESANMIMNVVLTGFLIWIYQGIAKSESDQAELQQQVTDIQEQQSEVLSRQEEWMEANHKPIIQVEDVRLLDDESDDVLQIRCANKGNGIATNLAIRCSIGVPLENGGSYIPQYKSLESRTDLPESLRSLSAGKTSLRKPSGNVRTHQGVALSPNETEVLVAGVTFSEVHYFGKDKSGGKLNVPVEFEEVVERLRTENISRFSFSISLYYEDILKRGDKVRLFEVYSDPTEGLTFLEAVKSHMEDLPDGTPI